MNSKNSSTKEESCVVLAKLCYVTYFLELDATNHQNNPLLVSIQKETGYIWEATSKQGTLVAYTNEKKGQHVFVVRGNYLSKGSREDCVKEYNEDILNFDSETSLSDIFDDFCSLSCEITFLSEPFIVIGHGVGGYVAEVISCIYGSPGLAFGSCSLSKTAKDFIYSRLTDRASGKVNRTTIEKDGFVVINSMNDILACQEGNTWENHLKPVLKIVPFTNETNHNFMEDHLIENMVKYFNRSNFIHFTNCNIDITDKLWLNPINGIDGRFNALYKSTEIDKLPLNGYNLTLYVCNLSTLSDEQLRLNEAIAAVNWQIRNDFIQHWGASGTLISLSDNSIITYKDEILNDEKDTKIGKTYNIANKMTNLMYQHRLLPYANWSKIGFIYILDKSDKHSCGYHNDFDIQGYNIPFAIVSANTLYDKDDQLQWTTNLSHEVLELLVNPWGKRLIECEIPIRVPVDDRETDVWDKQLWSIEVCDACQFRSYSLEKYSSIMLSDFVLPKYFDVTEMGLVNKLMTLSRESFQNSLANKVKYPFPMLFDGYMPFYNAEKLEEMEIVWKNSEEVIVKKAT